MTASDARPGWQRALCLVFVLGAAQLVPLASLGAHPDLWVPPIPYPGAGSDDLAATHRAWSVTGATDRVDVIGRADDPRAGEMAFRLLGDRAAFEGVIAAPDERNLTQPLANIGIRWHAVTFEPPLHFSGNRTLHRVLPGGLNWTVPVNDSTLARNDGRAFLTWASITVPINGSTAPEVTAGDERNASDADAPLWLAMSVSFVGEPREDADVGTRSPALARFAAAVWVNRSALQTPVTLYDTKATFSLHHDFGAAAHGLAASSDSPANVTGIYLKRGSVYTTARILDEARAWADADNVTGRRLAALTTFGVPAYGRMPHATPSSLLSPITLNVTVPMAPTRANITAWSLAGGPTVASGGNGAIVVAETGFLANGSLVPETVTTDPGGAPAEPSGTIPGPAAGTLAVVLVASAVLLRPSTPPAKPPSKRGR